MVETNGGSTAEKWDYTTFKEFLISQAQGDNFLLPMGEFPAEIELDKSWHSLLNSMRDATNKDNIERAALIGYSLTRRGIYLPSNEVAVRRWEKFEMYEGRQAVNPFLVELQQISARIEGIEGFIGLIHSHPPRLRLGGVATNWLGGRFSAGDLYHLLREGRFITGLCQGRINSFAFKTRESIATRDSISQFDDLWEGDPQPNNLDVVLAQKFKIALFKGNRNQALKRIV